MTGKLLTGIVADTVLTVDLHNVSCDQNDQNAVWFYFTMDPPYLIPPPACKGSKPIFGASR